MGLVGRKIFFHNHVDPNPNQHNIYQRQWKKDSTEGFHRPKIIPGAITAPLKIINNCSYIHWNHDVTDTVEACGEATYAD